MKNIFITGGSGFIGSHLVETLVKKGHNLKVLVKYNKENDIGWLENIEEGVKKNIDVRPLLTELDTQFNLQPIKDYVYFIDSTFFRIYFFNKEKNKHAIEYLSNTPCLNDNGIIIEKEAYKKFTIPDIPENYGNFIWWANPGVQIFPNFFSSGLRNQNILVRAMLSNDPRLQSSVSLSTVDSKAQIQAAQWLRSQDKTVRAVFCNSQRLQISTRRHFRGLSRSRAAWALSPEAKSVVKVLLSQTCTSPILLPWLPDSPALPETRLESN